MTISHAHNESGSLQRTLKFCTYFLKAYPARTALLVAALSLAAVLEGVGLLAILPLLEILVGTKGELSGLSQGFVRVLSAVGLSPSVEIIVGVIIAAFVLKAYVTYLAMRIVGFAVANVGHDLRLGLIHALVKAPWRYFLRRPTGILANAISSEAHRASWGYLSICSGLADAIQIGVYWIILAIISWPLALILAGAGATALFILRRFMAASRSAGNASTGHLQALVARMAELLPGIKAIKAMGLEREALPLLVREAEAFRSAQQRTVVAREVVKTAFEPILICVLALTFVLALRYTSFSLAQILLLAALCQRVITRATSLQGFYQSVLTNESAFFSIDTLTGEADASNQASPKLGAVFSGPLRHLKVENVSLSYGDKLILSRANLSLACPGLYSIQGPSGSGKTTLIDTILGLIPPDDGRVVVNGTPLSDLDRQSWRRHVGYLPQDALLFHDTVRANLSLGRTNITDEDLYTALEQAGASDFVSQLPAGLDEMIGERGATLSGGQRQRLCLARALVGQPALLILDEATAALDTATERSICQTLSALSKQMTIIAVSHQPTVHAAAMQVYTVADGLVTPGQAIEANAL